MQPAIELTERPGTALGIAKRGGQGETAFTSPAAEEAARTGTPVAWAEVKEEGPVGLEYSNQAALEAEEEEERERQGEEIEEIARAPTPVKNAWIDSRRGSVTESIRSKKSSTASHEGIHSLHPQAYIPYNVAKKNISKVINDMKLMREDHRNALIQVNQIYKEIEIETQVKILLRFYFTSFITTDLSSEHLYRVCDRPAE